MRFKFDSRKSRKLKADPRRQIGFAEVQEIWEHPFMWIVVWMTRNSFGLSDG